MRMKLALAAATCLSALPAAAQEPAPTQLAANEGAYDQIIVTSRRREENLLEVPAAISVIGGDLLDKSYTWNTQSLAQLVPALYYNSANPRNTAYTIRGLGSNTLSISAANDGMEAGVGFYVDQVYHGRPATASFDFTDIERIEVLRGPQGTLFGKNTADGAINIISKAPTFEPEGNIDVSYGDFDYFQVRGTVSGPIVGDKIAGRFSGQLTQRDGVIENVRTGQDLNTLNNYALKGQLLLQPTEDFRVRLIADVTDLDSVCCTQIYYKVGASLRSANRQFPYLSSFAGLPGGPWTPASTNVYDRVTDIDADLRIDTQDGGVAAITDWDIVDDLTLTSVTAWRYWDWDVQNDRDYTGIPIQSTQQIPSRQDQFSQELRVASSYDGPLNYVAGVYFFTQEISGRPTSIYDAAAAFWLTNPPAGFYFDSARATAGAQQLPLDFADGYGQIGDSDFKMSSQAVFGEANYDVTDKLTATLGLRYTYEDKEGSYKTEVFGGPAISGYSAAVQAQINTLRLGLFRPQNYYVEDDGGNVSGRFNLAYQVTDDLMTYAQYAHGYKSGGLNMAGLPLDANNQPTLSTAKIDDETNTTWEVGAKALFLDGRATASVAGYWTTVENFQTNIVSSQETAALRSYPANIPEVRVRGVELDAAANVFEGFTANLSVAYADGEYTDYPSGPCPLELQGTGSVGVQCPYPTDTVVNGVLYPAGTGALTGRSLSALSPWSGTLGLDYELPLGAGNVVLHSDTSYRSAFNSDTANGIYTRIKGYSVTNASIGYRFDAGFEVDVFAKNLFDKDYITALTTQSGNSGLILAQPSDPRLVGVTVRARY